jgi:hypothetical protein
MLPNSEGVKKFEGKAKEVFGVGGCVDAGLIVNAIYSGAKLGYTAL